jgi:DNA gyrase inhibitor GyrI
MSDFNVQIKNLEPMRVASVRVVSETPERDAWAKLRTWAESRGLHENLIKHPVFGFNNPNPAAHTKEYGYECWCSVGPDVEGQGEVEMKEIAGGLFASTPCKLKGGDIADAWFKLWEWVQSSPYKWRMAQELERLIDPHAAEEDMALELWLPVEEKS